MIKLSLSEARKLGLVQFGPGKQAEKVPNRSGSSRAVATHRKIAGQIQSQAALRPEPAGPVEVVIDGRPMAKEAVRGGRHGFFKSRKTQRYERFVQDCARLAMARQRPFSGPVAVDICYEIGYYKGFTERMKGLAAVGDLLPDTKPDFDNLSKSLMDGIKEIVFEDDAQICVSSFRKIFGPKSLVRIRIVALGKNGIRKPNSKKRK